MINEKIRCITIEQFARMVELNDLGVTISELAAMHKKTSAYIDSVFSRALKFGYEAFYDTKINSENRLNLDRNKRLFLHAQRR